MNEEDPNLLAGKNLDGLRARNPYHPMSERFRLTELLETANYQNNLLAQKCRELEKENFHLAANQCHSGYAGEYGHHRCSEIDRLTKERDEARWEVCGFHHLTGFLAGDYANSRGWNYFNDERKWPKFPQSVTDFKLFLEGQDKIFLESNDRLRKERDEAIIRANAVIREASALITAKIPSGKASAYWNAVDEFRRTESKTT
jgi:hypothetical protein